MGDSGDRRKRERERVEDSGGEWGRMGDSGEERESGG